MTNSNHIGQAKKKKNSDHITIPKNISTMKKAIISIMQFQCQI